MQELLQQLVKHDHILSVNILCISILVDSSIGRGNLVAPSNSRENTFITFTKFSEFWTLRPPLFAVLRNLSVLSFAKLATSFTPPPPRCKRERSKWIAPKGVQGIRHSVSFGVQSTIQIQNFFWSAIQSILWNADFGTPSRTPLLMLS